ncbi:MAG: thioredoxin domain-containing protein [Candidatus Limnocylindria bacterium]
MPKTERRVALLGALIGLFASAYLPVDYIFGSGICLTGSGCDIVRQSALAYPLGVPMPAFGVAFFLIAAALTLSGRPRIAALPTAVLAMSWALIGLGVMTVLTLVEVLGIRSLCSWCLLAAIGTALLAGGAIGTWRHSRLPRPAAVRSSRSRRRAAAETDADSDALRRFAAVSSTVLAITFMALLAAPALIGASPADQLVGGDGGAPPKGDGETEVVVFSDFQCPACAQAAPVLSQLADEGSIQLVYRYFPLSSIHAIATIAAEAAQAAARQGRFWEFHDALFARQSEWSGVGEVQARATFQQMAVDLGLDAERWGADATSATVAAAIATDRRAGEQLNLLGTPTIFIEGTRYEGSLDRASLMSAIESATSR